MDPVTGTVNRQRKKRRSTPQYWRRLITEAGIDPSDLYRLTENRTEWRKIVRKRMSSLEQSEKKSKGKREQTIEMNRNETKQLKSLTCRYCQKQCLNAGGLGIYMKRLHESNRNPNMFESTKCNSSFRFESAMKNHQESCKVGATNGIT